VSVCACASLSLQRVCMLFPCQSNMGIAVFQSLNATAEIAAANFPSIRIFQVALLPDYCNVTTPQTNLTASIPWNHVTPETIPGFSGLCYFFGRDLHLTENVNVGLINSCWGGTAIEVWMNPAALHACNETATPPLRGSTHGTSPASVLPKASRALASKSSVAADGSCLYASVPSTLYNSMIYPLTVFAVSGALWDQGEANTNDPNGYICKLSQLVTTWRTAFNANAGPFNPAFPFVYRQLHGYPCLGCLGPMRISMTQVADTVENVAMATSYDLASCWCSIWLLSLPCLTFFSKLRLG
jgi:sialate O-acetylesterase